MIKRGHYKLGYKYKRGYKAVYFPNHPFCNKDGYVLEHRIIMEKNLGRYLDPKEVVHHKNKIRDDNRAKNLELFSSHAVHLKNHQHSGDEIKKILYWNKENRQKISDENARVIRGMLAGGIKVRNVKGIFEISNNTLYNIKNKRGIYSL